MPRPDDDFDDRPRQPGRRRSAQSGSNKTVIIVVVAVLGVLLVGCAGVAALMFYSVSKVGEKDQEAADRKLDANKLKQLGLAFQLQEAVEVGIAGPFTRIPGGVNPDLSMRVDLLPYMDQDALHRQIDRGQAWDSPRNAPFTGQIVRELQSPLTPNAGNATPYRAFVGGGALFDADGKPFSLTSIPDGASNTILLVHAAEAVPWAKPEELAYSPTAPLPKLGAAVGPTGYNVLMADGSVRWLKNPPEQTLRLLIEKADGNVIPPFE